MPECAVPENVAKSHKFWGKNFSKQYICARLHIRWRSKSFSKLSGNLYMRGEFIRWKFFRESICPERVHRIIESILFLIFFTTQHEEN